jgi:hypothetical protein
MDKCILKEQPDKNNFKPVCDFYYRVEYLFIAANDPLV